MLSWLCLILLVACGGGSSAPDTPATGGIEAATVDEVLVTGVRQGVDAIWLYVDDGISGSTKVLGQSSRATLAPARPNDLFKIASISKLFIAVATIKLADASMLTLDDTLAFWLPTEAARIDNADQITVRHLLQHRSGVPDFDSQPGFSWRRDHTDEDLLLDTIYDMAADFQPDAQYAYSNTNYLLLGRILNAALGYHHHYFVQNAILSPLGMNATVSVLADVDVALLARGYWEGVDRTEQDYTIPGGSMVSTASDVGVFMRSLARGSLLSDRERDLYESVFSGYAHSGWLPGFQSVARYYADIDTVIVQFINMTGGNSEQVAQDVHASVLEVLRGS